MSASGITLATGSARPFTLPLLDKSNQPVDLTIGTWRADLYIMSIPGASSSPLRSTFHFSRDWYSSVV
jgi:hypothetical protein